MNTVINRREPAAFFRYFEEISAIPRPSYHEEAIADYLEAFAKARGLGCYRDKLCNVLIKAPASQGREHEPALLLQGHTDMVCEKNNGVEHDFFNDSLKLWVDGNLLRAKGTTLGADNGVAVAAMLALLDGAIASHPAYECLFTTAEEVGLEGAHGFDYSLISARKMINMDGCGLGFVICGCAGGLRSELTMKLSPVPFCGTALKLTVNGLIGGHSGEHIHCGRANANKLMGRLLAGLKDVDFHIVSLLGGSKDNAIPRECEAVIAVADADAARTEDLLTVLAEQIAKELSSEDRHFRFAVCETQAETVMLSATDTAHAVAILACAANGVQEMNREMEGLVEYSRNLAVIHTENDCLTAVFSSRSAMESRIDASMNELDALAAVTGCKTRHYSRYPGWDYAPVSPLRDAYVAAYTAVTGKEATVNAIHAGLECGIIYSKLPDMDMISIGPDMFDIHSPDEALDLNSVEVFWNTLVKLIEG